MREKAASMSAKAGRVARLFIDVDCFFPYREYNGDARVRFRRFLYFEVNVKPRCA